MPSISQIQRETLKVHIIKRPDVNIIKSDRLHVQHKMGKVLLLFGNSMIRMNTITSHKLGLSIGLMAPKLDPDSVIELLISGESLKMEYEVALRVSGAILKKTDDADDYQLQSKRRVIL